MPDAILVGLSQENLTEPLLIAELSASTCRRLRSRPVLRRAAQGSDQDTGSTSTFTAASFSAHACNIFLVNSLSSEQADDRLLFSPSDILTKGI